MHACSHSLFLDDGPGPPAPPPFAKAELSGLRALNRLRVMDLRMLPAASHEGDRPTRSAVFASDADSIADEGAGSSGPAPTTGNAERIGGGGGLFRVC